MRELASKKQRLEGAFLISPAYKYIADTRKQDLV